MARIVHIAPAEKFIPDFMGFLSRNIGLEEHLFYIIGDHEKYNIHKSDHVVFIKKDFASLGKLLAGVYRAKKVILHGLFFPEIILFLFFQPWLLGKCYWFIWGGDLYVYEKNRNNKKRFNIEYFRRPVIKNMGHLVTYIQGDYARAKKWYKAKGKYQECLLYPSNTYKNVRQPEIGQQPLTLLVGNSADPANRHTEIFAKLKAQDDREFRVVCPLSYGDMEYAKKTAKEGQLLFGNRFTALVDMMPLKDYLEILAQVDIAVFAHRRQQAMGTTITLLGLGKRVYLRSDMPPWDVFTRKGIDVFDVDCLDIEPLDNETARKNIARVKEAFSQDVYLQQLESLFS